MNFKELFQKLYSRENLTLEESKAALYSMMENEWEPAQTSAFLTALHLKGEAGEELAGFAIAMREKAVSVPTNGLKSIDTCGTGGDRKRSFNISTVTAFVLAGCGIPVAKHGNRAASSSCGSADLLEALGIRARLHPEEAAESLTKQRFAFLFAPDYHPATKSVVAVRKLLGLPTIFNFLGPLTNPADPAAQLIGVYDRAALPLMAEAIHRCNASKEALFVHAEEGWDEATPCGPFLAYRTSGEPSIFQSSHFGLEPCSAEELSGGSPPENATIAIAILEGEKSGRRRTVILNALLAYMLFHNCQISEARRAVEASIDSGAARNVVEQLKRHYPAES